MKMVSGVVKWSSSDKIIYQVYLLFGGALLRAPPSKISDHTQGELPLEKPGNKQDEESAKDWKLLFELYEILKKRVDDREEKMRDYVRKVGLTEKEKSKDEQQ